MKILTWPGDLKVTRLQKVNCNLIWHGVYKYLIFLLNMIRLKINFSQSFNSSIHVKMYVNILKSKSYLSLVKGVNIVRNEPIVDWFNSR